MEFLTSANLLNLLTLSGLEIILGIDNVIFIALLVAPLPLELQKKVRLYGLSLALIFRILLLFGAKWMIGLTEPLFEIMSVPINCKHIMLFSGGMFLLVKAILEIRSMLNEKEEENIPDNISTKSIWYIIYQVIFIDIILSFDSIITAVGMSPDNIAVIIIAVIIAIFVMLAFSGPVGSFINKYPSIKILGLCFIGLVGLFLMAEGIDLSIAKGYLYFALFFSGIIQTLNILISKKQDSKNEIISR